MVTHIQFQNKLYLTPIEVSVVWRGFVDLGQKQKSHTSRYEHERKWMLLLRYAVVGASQSASSGKGE